MVLFSGIPERILINQDSPVLHNTTPLAELLGFIICVMNLLASALILLSCEQLLCSFDISSSYAKLIGSTREKM